MPHLVVSITGHGFGHVAQTAPVLNALHAHTPYSYAGLVDLLTTATSLRPSSWWCEPSLVRDIVTQPATLHERVDEYLKQLRETESCAI